MAASSHRREVATTRTAQRVKENVQRVKENVQ